MRQDRSYVRRLSAAAGLILALCAPLAADEPSPKQAIVAQLQQAVRDNDKAWLAEHVRYPLHYYGPRKLVVRDKTAFIRDCASLFGAKLRAAILAQDPASVFENSQGLMIGEGLYNVWVRDTGDGGTPRYQIIAINGP